MASGFDFTPFLKILVFDWGTEKMTGVLINAGAILIGALIGMVLKRGIPGRISDTVMKGVGLCVMYIGWSGAMQCKNTLILIISVVLGALIGEGIDIDRRFNRAAEKIEKKISKKDKKISFAEGFVSASLLFCVGAMAVVGSIQAGIDGNNETLIAKSLIDFISAIIFASTMGVGVAASSVSVLLYQGVIALSANGVSGFLTENVVVEMTAVGSVLIFALGMNLVGLSKFKIMNYLPAVFIPVALCHII